MFESIPGQELAKAYFAAAFPESLSHAYLLVGQEGLGKTQFALELGAAIVSACGGCGHCDECERARRGLHPDLTVVEREGELIRIDQVERLVAELSLKPFLAERRVWVIPEAEKLGREAANKLLKSLEEPPAHVYFLLVSDEPERVLPTISSRCQVVEFRPVSDAVVAAYLGERCGLGEAEAAALARLARGSVERAVRLADDARGAQRRARFTKLAAAIAARDRDAAHAFVEEVSAGEQAAAEQVATAVAAQTEELERTISDAQERAWRVKRIEERGKRDKARVTRLVALDALDYLAAWLRDALVMSYGGEAAVWNVDRRDELEQARLARPDLYERMLEITQATRKNVLLNVDRKLALQAMFARFEEVQDGA